MRAGEFELVPYVRGEYRGRDAEAIDLVTAPYREIPDVPISEAVFLRVENAELVADLNDKQLEAAFTFAEMVALVGLARRKFFLHSGYSNRDNYRLVVQGYDEPARERC